ncbi:MAG: hypothetical protein ING66_06505 [Rhodocyclaceae bacterium]|nr:hypothetical protein [Rhodocyclaceae bacterium]MCA3033659.1 hypothetical protein [Rhodocyclaceae bacterium]MCA3055295.1 hypothetical protein [Rhodocyclaceae bacterium]MCA3084192.1 hypothetical protein [Rhodocyclaceae bacterium]
MTSSKFKNNGSFATSAMVSALVIAMHVAGMQLLAADQEATYQGTIAREAANAVKPALAKPVVRTDAFVVTASRLKS